MGKTRIALIFLLFFTASSAVLAAGGWRSVSVRQGALRLSPMPFGKIVASLPYGERVEILTEQGVWFKVREESQGRQGWMHGASLLDRKLTLRPGETVGPAASEDELALGGKGFNAQVEASYRAGGRRVDYASVDRMEGINVHADEQRLFLRQGGLLAGEEERP